MLLCSIALPAFPTPEVPMLWPRKCAAFAVILNRWDGQEGQIVPSSAWVPSVALRTHKATDIVPAIAKARKTIEPAPNAEIYDGLTSATVL